MMVATISTVKRAVWLLAVCLYAAAAAADIAAHLISDARAGQSWHDPANLADPLLPYARLRAHVILGREAPRAHDGHERHADFGGPDLARSDLGTRRSPHRH